MTEDLVFDQPLPSNLDAEKLVLGHMLSVDNGFDDISLHLKADAFHVESHRRIFRAAEDVIRNTGALDCSTLALALEQSGHLESVGGRGYLLDIGSLNLIDVTPFCRAISAAAIRRRAILLASEVMHRAWSDMVTVEELTAQAESQFRELAKEGIGPSSWDQIGNIPRNFPGGLDPLLAWRKHSRGLPSPWHSLNKITGGFQRGELIILAAAPGQGKTAMIVQTAQHVAQQPRTGGEEVRCVVGIISLEMEPETIYPRMVAQIGRVDSTAMSWGTLDSEGRGRAMYAVKTLDPLPIFFDRANSSTPMEVRARVTALNREHSLDLLIIDNLSLMKNRGENRNLQIAGITREMKLLAKELHIPVVILVHLSREVEKRNPPRPVMGDLRDSGAIAQDADLVLFIFRPEAYLPPNHEREDLVGVAEFIVGKQRNGRVGTLNMVWLPEFQRFDERYEG